MTTSLDALKADHRRIEAELLRCDEAVQRVSELAKRLEVLRPIIKEHLAAKERFYAELRERCGDLASGNLARMFEENMRVQSNAILRFFEGLDAGVVSPLLGDLFKTMALVIRTRLATEERAVFPLYLAGASTGPSAGRSAARSP
jgi:hypothetical protein